MMLMIRLWFIPFEIFIFLVGYQDNATRIVSCGCQRAQCQKLQTYRGHSQVSKPSVLGGMSFGLQICTLLVSSVYRTMNKGFTCLIRRNSSSVFSDQNTQSVRTWS